MTYPVIDVKATAAKIKALRLARGLTVREVQQFLALQDPQAVYKWERGCNLPSLDNLLALSLLLKASVEDILVYHN